MVLSTPSPGHDSSVGLEKGSVHQRKLKYTWNYILLIQAVYYSAGNVVTESRISHGYGSFWLCSYALCGLSALKHNR